MDQFGQKKSPALLISVICLSVFLVAAIAFALWAFTGRQDYKNNVDKKVAAASAKVKADTQAEDQAVYAKKAQEPYIQYRGSDTYGGLDITYPKNWNLYVNAAGDDKSGIDWYFNPVAVPSIKGVSTYALRAQVLNSSYDSVVAKYKNAKGVTISAYSLPKVKGVTGTRINGQITKTTRGSLVILPLRDKTVQLWTESSNFMSQFNTIILPNVTFVP